MTSEIPFCDTCEEDVSDEKLKHCKYLRHELLEKPKESFEEKQQEEKTSHQHNANGKKIKSRNNLDRNDSKIHNLKGLTQIEDPQLAGKLVKVTAVVASNTLSYNVPVKIDVKCFNESEDHKCQKDATINLQEIDLVPFVDVTESKRQKNLQKIVRYYYFNGSCKLKITEEKSTTLKKLKVRPIVSSLEKNDGKFLDDDGNEWKAYDVYLQQDKIQKLDAGKEIEITGRIIPDPKSQRVTLIISDTHEVDAVNYDLDRIKLLKEFFTTKSVQERVSWITKEFEKYSQIVKRRNVSVCGFLTFFSPITLEFDGKIILGWVKSTVIGDTTTGKSETIKRLITLLQGGQIISGETASVVGLGAVATQSTNQQWFLEFGPLVLQDRRLLAVDGAHQLGKESWATLAEAEREGKLRITKAAKGEGYARTRQIKIMNPLGDDLRTTRPMDSFFYSVQAIQNNLQIQSLARQDLVAFVRDDVNPEDRNKKIQDIHDKRLEELSELLKFVWEQKYDIKFDDDATEEILSKATMLENKFKFDEIPLVTNDQKYKLAKLSTSLAALTCSFNDDFTKLVVTKEHVEYIVKFIEREYHDAGLDVLAGKSHNAKIEDETIDNIVLVIRTALKHKDPEPDDQVCKNILLWVSERNKFTKDELRAKFELARDNELQPLIGALKNEEIINNSRGGFSPTRKGIEVGKYLTKTDLVKGRGSSFGNTRDTNHAKTADFSTSSTPSTAENSSPPQITRKFRCVTCKTDWFLLPINSLNWGIYNKHRDSGHKIEEVKI